MFAHFDTLFTRMNANLDRLSLVPVGFLAVLAAAVLAAVVLEQNTGARAAAALLQLGA